MCRVFPNTVTLVLFNTVDPAVLIIEKQFIFLHPNISPLLSLAAYYVFNIEYVKGVFTTLEIMLLKYLQKCRSGNSAICTSAAALDLNNTCSNSLSILHMYNIISCAVVDPGWF